MHIVFVTGLSGAGKSQTMKTFEDLGFYCVDNLPPALVEPTVNLLEEAGTRRAAIALDVRSGGPLGNAVAAIDAAAAGREKVDVLFVDSADETLLRRYSETRRRHPFASAGSLREAIASERALLAPLRARATQTIDTTGATHRTLKERIREDFAPDQRDHRLDVNLVAFGFKYGLPLDVDLLFDVRFLRNPNYDDTLRPLTGSDAAVAAYIEADPALEPFLEKTIALLDFLLPRYDQEGKARLTIGIGCTGGRHRSVYVARRLAAHVRHADAYVVALETRDAHR
jgi:UPF0042 nucleotide-binding protein